MTQESTKFQNVRPSGVTRKAFLRAVMAAGAVGVMIPRSAHAVTQAEIDAAKTNYDKLKATLDEIAQEYASKVATLNETAQKVEDVNTQISDTQAQIDAKQTEIDAKEKEIADKRSELGKRMSDAYKSGPTGALEVLLSSGSFDELVSNIYYLDKITEKEHAIITEIDELKGELVTQQNELKTKESELQTQKSELEALKSTQYQQVQEAQAKQDEATNLVNEAAANLQGLQDQQQKEFEEMLARARQAQENNIANSGGGVPVGTGGTGGTASTPSGGSAGTGSSSGSLSRVISAAYATGSRGPGYCAGYITDVFRNAGFGFIGGNANDMYWAYCYTSDRSQLQPGMIVAVPTSPWGLAQIYGHIGLYIGNGVIRENATGPITETSVDAWIRTNGGWSTPRWGWLGGIVLS